MIVNQTIEAVKQATSQAPQRNFKENVDLAINLKNVDMSKPENRLDEEILLPNGLGKPIKIAVFAKGDIAQRAVSAGADLIISPEDIEQFKEDKSKARTIANDVDYFIAEVSYMPSIAKSLGPVLGPRGKMPEPLTPDKHVEDVVKKAKNTIKVRSKDRLTFHLSVGRKDMEPEKLAENIDSIISRIEHKLANGKHNIRSIYVKTTMGPAVRVM